MVGGDLKAGPGGSRNLPGAQSTQVATFDAPSVVEYLPREGKASKQ